MILPLVLLLLAADPATAAKPSPTSLRPLPGDHAEVPGKIALLAPAKPQGEEDESEWQTAHDTAARVSQMLDELGLPCETLSETAVLDGALERRSIAVLAYHPHLGDAQTAALVRFVRSGGKLLACYLLPPRLATALGFGNAQYVRQQRPGQFAEIRFQAADIAGLPASVRQDSWNIMVLQPAGFHARIIGRWFDDAGKPTGRAACLLSDRGAFFSHVLLPDDRQAKKQMLAAILGHLSPPLWPRMGQAQLERSGRAGHCGNLQETAAYVNAGGDRLARQTLDAAAATLAVARDQLAEGRCVEATVSARRGHEQLAEAYLRALPSPQREGRAVWNHSGTGAYPGDWDRSARELARNGFNMILPNMLWGGQAHYPSDVLPPSDTFRRYGDQIAQCLAAARKYHLEVHVWKVHFNLAGAPPEFIARLRREHRTQVSVQGRPVDWLCPSDPANRQLEVQSMLEVARRYPVDGLQMDYIRYPDGHCCYCDGCRKRFEADSGRRVDQWPADCYSGARKDEYNDWRCRQITLLVTAIRRELKRLHPEMKLSAAVWGGYPDCRRWVAQDWPAWVRAGDLDFICPMDYTEDPKEFARWVGQQMDLVGGRIPVYPGIGATASSSGLSADGVAGQIYYARLLGAGGFSIFNFDHATAASIMPGVGLARAACRPFRRTGRGEGKMK